MMLVTSSRACQLAFVLLGLAIVPLATKSAHAGYVNIDVPAAGDLQASDFTFFATPTAWNPGTNTARVGGFPAPGGATFSIMGAGFVDGSGFDTGHSGTTGAITVLGISGYTAASYAADINSALNVWAAVSGFTNLGQVADGGVNAGALEASGGHLGDIRVAAWEIVTSGVLAHAFQPGTQAVFGPGGTITGDVHIDISHIWANDPTDTIADSDIDFYTVLLHEFGHALGLGHSAVSGSVMEPVYAGSRRVLSADDIAGIQAIYGPEPDVAVVPEPGSLLLFAFGTALLGSCRNAGRYRRRR